MLICFLLTNTMVILLISVERLTGERNYSLENKFGDSDDGSHESLQARKVALLVSKSILSLSSFAGISWVLLSSHLLHIWFELKLSKVVLLKFRWKEDPCLFRICDASNRQYWHKYDLNLSNTC
jgi:hypothetical protein